MIMTSSALFYLLSRKYSLSGAALRSANAPVRRVRILRSGDPTQPDTLYVCGRWADAVPAEPVRGSVLFCGCRGAEETPPFFPEADYACLEGTLDETAAFEALVEAWTETFDWNARMADAILRREPPETVLSIAEEFLSRYWALIDRDMNALHIAGAPFDGMVLKPGERFPEDNVQALLVRKDFHDAAFKREPFYYYDHYTDKDALCLNIFVDGQYYARLVAPLDQVGQKPDLGEEQLFRVAAARIEEAFQHSMHLRLRHQNDELHRLCRAMILGEGPAEDTAAGILRKSGWQPRHLYAAIRLSFFCESGWDTQLEMTLPYLCRELERQWSQSCAIISGREVLWVVNRSLSGVDSDSHAFYQALASFVRDNVCSAGVSAGFSDFSLLPYAMSQAAAALDLGRRRQPHFWYFLFDDYRLDYMLEKITGEMPGAVLRHPAVAALEDYDEANDTELSKTLRAFLLGGLNATLAADSIFIHRTTFCRRMEKIRALTGVDTDDPDTVLQLLLSYRLTQP